MTAKHLHVSQELSEPGAQVNEDLVWHQGNSYMVLDGASSLTSDNHDAVPFVRAFAESYARLPYDKLPLHQCVNNAIDTLRPRFDPTRYEQGICPSASLVLLRALDDVLELLLVGDCSCHCLRSAEGAPAVWQTFYLNEVQRFDTRALSLAAQLGNERGCSLREAIHDPRVHQQLIDNRLMMNQPDGYRILAANMAPLTDHDVIRLPYSGLRYVLLHSDGFDQAAERVMEADRPDLAEAYQWLRDEERADAGFNRWPRFKQGDDASALLLGTTSDL